MLVPTSSAKTCLPCSPEGDGQPRHHLPLTPLALLLDTFEFQIEFPHFARVLGLLCVERMVNFHFHITNPGNLRDGYDQHDDGEDAQRDEKW